MTSTTKPEFLVIDMETTGLDARDEVPLELGLAVTDLWGNILHYKEWMIYEATSKYVKCIAEAQQHHVVGPMHTASGLWRDLESVDTRVYTRAEVDDEASIWLEEVGGNGLPLMGNSIGSLDRPFILQHFPIINETVHYRNIDISSVKELCRRYNPGLYEAMNKSPLYAKKEVHRVRQDIVDSLAELGAYVEEFLIVDEVED